MKHLKYFESSRIISYDSHVEKVCGLDKEEIEHIFQDVLDEFHSMEIRVDSIPVFNTEDKPLIISLMVDRNFTLVSERENGRELGTMFTILDRIELEYLEEIEGRLEDHGLKIKDIRLVRIGSSLYRKYHEGHIVIRIVSI